MIKISKIDNLKAMLKIYKTKLKKNGDIYGNKQIPKDIQFESDIEDPKYFEGKRILYEKIYHHK